MALLDGKKLLITGVLTDRSIAYSVARRAQEEGAEIVLTGFGRAMRLTQRMAQRLPQAPDVLELDVTDEEQLASVVAELEGRWGVVDGVLHAIAFVPGDALGGRFLEAPVASATSAFEISAFSLKSLGAACAAAGEGAGRRLARWPGLRRDRCVADLRLGRREQGRAGVGQPLPGAVPRAARHPLQPHRRRAPADDGGRRDRGLRRPRAGLGAGRAAAVGPRRPRAGRRRVPVPALLALAGGDRGDPARRRRVPRARRARRARRRGRPGADRGGARELSAPAATLSPLGGFGRPPPVLGGWPPVRRIRDFMPATLSVGVRPMEGIVAATSKDIAWLLPRDPRDPTPGLLPRPAQISFRHQGHLVVLHGNAERAPQGTVAFQASREGRVDNLRASPRLDVQLPVRVTGSGMTRETTTLNVSAGGALIAGGFFGARDSLV